MEISGNRLQNTVDFNGFGIKENKPTAQRQVCFPEQCFLIGAACQTAADCTFGADPCWKPYIVLGCPGASEARSSPSVSHSFSKAPRRMFWLTPMVKQKAFGTRPDVQIPREKGSQAVWEGLGTGTCFYFLPIPAPLACSLPPTGISVVQNHIQSTELARLRRHCNRCNTKFIFPVTIQPKKSMAQCIKNIDKVLCNHSLKTNPEMAVLYF